MKSPLPPLPTKKNYEKVISVHANDDLDDLDDFIDGANKLINKKNQAADLGLDLDDLPDTSNQGKRVDVNFSGQNGKTMDD